MSTPEPRPVPESLPDVRDEQGQRICAVAMTPDASVARVIGLCGKPHRARGRCVDHYYEALREVRRSPDVPRHRELGEDREQISFWVSAELYQAIGDAVATSNPRTSRVRWLEAAIRAQLERDPNATRAGRAR